jgi:hypothetical protein
VASAPPPPPPPSARVQSRRPSTTGSSEADAAEPPHNSVPLSDTTRFGNKCSVNGEATAAEAYRACTRLESECETKNGDNIDTDLDPSLCHDGLLTWRSKWPEGVEVEISQRCYRTSEAGELLQDKGTSIQKWKEGAIAMNEN